MDPHFRSFCSCVVCLPLPHLHHAFSSSLPSALDHLPAASNLPAKKVPPNLAHPAGGQKLVAFLQAGKARGDRGSQLAVRSSRRAEERRTRTCSTTSDTRLHIHHGFKQASRVCYHITLALSRFHCVSVASTDLPPALYSLHAARKLVNARRENRWSDLHYKKRALGTAYRSSPTGGSSHAKGIVLEKVGHG